MERRVALKNMGMVFGYAVAAPTVLSLVQSCKGKKVLDWTPEFFTKEEGGVVHTILDIILPKTDTPSATDVNVHVFLDKFANEVMPVEEQEFLKMCMGKFTDKVLADSQKETLNDLDAEDVEPVLAVYLKKQTDEVEELHAEAIEAYREAMETNGSAVLDDEVACFNFANSMRGSAIWAYKTSEFVAEEVLAYLPIPGQYVACDDVDTLTQGRAWSL
ncbi:gluconate 2-dehydrogenase subunit 3 family protein [Muricauda sp. 2012CJ35-5]|uniref:Gluconate 2-dehydrogenase subunit 3 family protein n=1 Tax=Flagellimonas spongiicola TaxID=2942208 RepID=A0ABT0PSS2_9FLAO|nr:gluconate 2-dehydrogenase subunit 3 family protein [Allomuricauda spongiicola]MCL6274439.1 gluconate 2-dehydrogenase subunit 3 family protein [Allomuricauda spongiicola]